MTASRVYRCSSWDALLVAAALAQGVLLALATVWFRASLTLALPSALMMAVGVWWCSNTVSHNHLHNPLFRSRALNRALSMYLTLLTGIPQSIWRARHLWHHAGETGKKPRAGAMALVEGAALGGLWALMIWRAPMFFFAAYVPGYLAGMLLCQAQGHFEHVGVGAPGISHYGALYNALWFNDGYHVEHHRHPTEHWTRLPSRREASAAWSPLPPVLRWWSGLVNRLLGALEECAIAWPRLQRFMLATHERAFRKLSLPRPARVCVVGGGLFPRTALVLRRIWPDVPMVIVDASAENLACARQFLDGERDIVFREARFTGRVPDHCDLVIAPLAFAGDRDALYGSRVPMIVHDWIWRRRGRTGAVISWLLCKRLNLV
jgi:fatty acid desaturase